MSPSATSGPVDRGRAAITSGCPIVSDPTSENVVMNNVQPRPDEGDLTVRSLRGRDDLALFGSIPYVLNEELEGDLDGGRRRLDWLWVALRADRLVGRVGWWTRSADDPPLALDILDVSDVDDGIRLVETAMRAVLPAG